MYHSSMGVFMFFKLRKWNQIAQRMTYEYLLFFEYFSMFINPFHVNLPLLYPLKNSENVWFSGVFREYRNEAMWWNGPSWNGFLNFWFCLSYMAEKKSLHSKRLLKGYVLDKNADKRIRRWLGEVTKYEILKILKELTNLD